MKWKVSCDNPHKLYEPQASPRERKPPDIEEMQTGDEARLHVHIIAVIPIVQPDYFS